MSELATSDLLYDSLLVLILALLASWLVMLGAAVIGCLRDGHDASADAHVIPSRQ